MVINLTNMRFGHCQDLSEIVFMNCSLHSNIRSFPLKLYTVAAYCISALYNVIGDTEFVDVNQIITVMPNIRKVINLINFA